VDTDHGDRYLLQLWEDQAAARDWEEIQDRGDRAALSSRFASAVSAKVRALYDRAGAEPLETRFHHTY
jgi:hypothetical protein